MSTDPIRQSSPGFDLSARIISTTTVVASPAAAAETIIAQLTVAAAEAVVSGINLLGVAMYTVGTNGTAVRFRLRRTNVGGTVVGDTGALTGGVAAAALRSDPIATVDTSPTLPNQIYCLTMQVTAGSAPSTVSAVFLNATVV